MSGISGNPTSPHSARFAEWEHALREYPDLPDLCRADAVLLELGEYESESDASS